MGNRSKEQRYYWLKLQEDWFEKDEVKILLSRPNGADHVVILLKLYLRSINTEGVLVFNNAIYYDPATLAAVTHTNPDVLAAAIRNFTSLGLMTVNDEGGMTLPEVPTMTGSETGYAAIKRAQRIPQLPQGNPQETPKAGPHEPQPAGDEPKDAPQEGGHCPPDVHEPGETMSPKRIETRDIEGSYVGATQPAPIEISKILCYQNYERLIGTLATMAREGLNAYLDAGIQDVVICAVLDECAASGHRSWPYIRSCLERLATSRIYTLGAYHADKAAYDARKAQEREQRQQATAARRQSAAPASMQEQRTQATAAAREFFRSEETDE